MSLTEIYVTEWCTACHAALDKLQAAGIEVEVVSVDSEEALYKAFKVWEDRLGYNPNSIPQLWYQGKHIGGSTNIDKFLKEQNAN
jgi:glutaredoxin